MEGYLSTKMTRNYLAGKSHELVYHFAYTPLVDFTLAWLSPRIVYTTDFSFVTSRSNRSGGTLKQLLTATFLFPSLRCHSELKSKSRQIYKNSRDYLRKRRKQFIDALEKTRCSGKLQSKSHSRKITWRSKMKHIHTRYGDCVLM